VEVDVETGKVRVLRYAACHDVGRIINPVRVEGQIHGGVAQGIGYALTEEVRVADGLSESSLFADYLIPVSTDVPDIRAIALEVGPGKGPFGARGIGEPPIGPPAAAIANAVADAIGVRVTDLPITPERVLAALRQAGAGTET
jgi:CO/xanthine dehydrogenase Mo-binding subunit